MYTFEKEDRTITSAKIAISKLNCDIEKLTKAIVKNNIYLIILPKSPLSMGIRFPENHHISIFERAGKNPLHIEVGNFDGFIPSTISNEKILHTLNWKTAEPYAVVRTNPKQNLIKEYTPYTLALKSVVHEGKCDSYCPCGIKDLRAAYKNQIFYFKNHASHNTKISLDEIYLINIDIKKIAHHLYEESKIDFNEVGDYQENPWSKKLIKDINAIHHHLKKNNKINNISDKKIAQTLVQKWLEERYKSKEITSICFEQIPKIVTEDEKCIKKINFEPFLREEIEDIINTKSLSYKLALEASINEKKKRNRKNATDLIVLLDIISEKNYKGKKEAEALKKQQRKEGTKKEKNKSAHPEHGKQSARYNSYTHSSKITEKLESSGIEKGVLQQAIYSIINHTFSDIKKCSF